MKKHELKISNGTYDTRLQYHNGKIVIMTDVKDTVRLYFLREQSHEKSQIDFMTLRKFKYKIVPKPLSNLTDTYKLDVIYFGYHELDESHYKGL